VGLFIIALLSATLIYLPQFTQRAALFGSGVVLQPGQAYCPANGATASGTSPPSGCLATGQFLQVTLVDSGNTATKLSGWSASLISNGGPFNTAPAGQIIDSCLNTGSNGQCLFNAVGYIPGQSLIMWICHSTTACGTGSFAKQVTTLYVAFPGLPGAPGGTVPFFSGTQSPTSTPTTGFFLPVLLLAGDAATSNTPLTFTFTFPNGTSIATGTTCFLNQAKGTNPCYFGAGVTKPVFTVSIQHNFVGTVPYANGFNTFNELNIPSRGVLSTNIRLEIKQTVGSDPIPIMLSSGPGSGPFPSSPTATKQGSVPDVFYVSGDQASTLTQRINQDNTIASSGSVNYSFGVDTTAQSTSGDKSQLIIDVLTYFSFTYFTSTNGSANSEAVTQMTQYVITLQTP
jgi:hypothetical protein